MNIARRHAAAIDWRMAAWHLGIFTIRAAYNVWATGNANSVTTIGGF
jgi:hypothetical protein